MIEADSQSERAPAPLSREGLADEFEPGEDSEEEEHDVKDELPTRRPGGTTGDMPEACDAVSGQKDCEASERDGIESSASSSSKRNLLLSFKSKTDPKRLPLP
jgi:hypothetical protein